MASFKTDSFVTAVVGVSIAVVVFAMVALPIITQAASTEGIDSNLAAIINVIPIFIVLGILMACIYLFIQKKA